MNILLWWQKKKAWSDKGRGSWVVAMGSLRKAWKCTDFTGNGSSYPLIYPGQIRAYKLFQAVRPRGQGKGKQIPRTNCPHLFNPVKPFRLWYVLKVCINSRCTCVLSCSVNMMSDHRGFQSGDHFLFAVNSHYLRLFLQGVRAQWRTEHWLGRLQRVKY